MDTPKLGNLSCGLKDGLHLLYGYNKFKKNLTIRDKTGSSTLKHDQKVRYRIVNENKIGACIQISTFLHCFLGRQAYLHRKSINLGV